MTTAAAAYSRVLLMPLNTLALSAAFPSGPVTWEARPFAPVRAIARMDATGVTVPFQPLLPTLTDTRVCIALPSAEPIGPATVPGTTPGIAANRRASAAALARSAGVIPEAR